MPKEEKKKLERTKSDYHLKCLNEITDKHSEIESVLEALKDLETRVSQLEQLIEDLPEDSIEGWDSTEDFEEDRISETE